MKGHYRTQVLVEVFGEYDYDSDSDSVDIVRMGMYLTPLDNGGKRDDGGNFGETTTCQPLTRGEHAAALEDIFLSPKFMACLHNNIVEDRKEVNDE